MTMVHGSVPHSHGRTLEERSQYAVEVKGLMLCYMQHDEGVRFMSYAGGRQIAVRIRQLVEELCVGNWQSRNSFLSRLSDVFYYAVEQNSLHYTTAVL